MKYKNIIITVLIIIAGAAAIYGFTVYNKTKPQAVAVSAADNNHADSIARLDTAKVKTPQGPDPCNGTGGTGQIINIDSNSITIKRRDSSNEIIKLTDKTIIKNSAGVVSKSGLKTGDRVTVVVMSKHTATAVLVCNEKAPGKTGAN